MTRTILVVPQNDSHAATAAVLAPALKSRGVDTLVLDVDGIYHQGTAPFLENLPTLRSELAADQPFYRMSPRAQLGIVARAMQRVERWLEDVDGVVAFNDGAIQRLLLGRARRHGLSTDLVLDGMITFLDPPLTARRLVRHALQRLARNLDGSDVAGFLPSEVGLTGVDRVHVGGRHSATVLRRRGSRARRILASGLPGWPEPEWDAPARVQRVLYLTGAFRWHDDPVTAAAQERDLKALAIICENLGLHLAVRVHPRDDKGSYFGLQAEVFGADRESMSDSIRRADAVLSIVSTGLIEGVLLGKPTRVVAIHPNWARYRWAFVADPLFNALRDVQGLRQALSEMMAGVDQDELASQREALEPYVAATGTKATAAIADAIVFGVEDAATKRFQRRRNDPPSRDSR